MILMWEEINGPVALVVEILQDLGARGDLTGLTPVIKSTKCPIMKRIRLATNTEVCSRFHNSEQVPEHVKKAAREMNRKAFAEKLREIKMSEYDSQMYEQYSMGVRRQVQSIRNILDSLQAKSADR